MPTNTGFQPQGTPRPEIVGYETRDASPKWIFVSVGFLFAAGLAIHFIVGGLLNRFKGERMVSDAWGFRVKTPSAPPAYPQLQISPPLDLQSFQAREEAELTQYGWINKTAGVIRIPIERAMDLVLQTGFPVRSGTNANEKGPSSYQLIQQRSPKRHTGPEK